MAAHRREKRVAALSSAAGYLQYPSVACLADTLLSLCDPSIVPRTSDSLLWEEGERVVSGQGVAWVQHLSWREERAVVHNLWVAGSHRYRVGAGEIEVHNECWLNKALSAMGQSRANIPAWMSNPHGHHIIPVNLNRAASARVREIAAKLQDLAQQHGLDIRNDPRNLAVSPNGMGTHSVEGLQAVYDFLSRAGSNNAAFLQRLQRVRETMWHGDFYRQLGRLN